MDHPLLYEINTRCWLHDLTGAVGNRIHLGNVPDGEFDRWERLGITHIWLMGVWKTSAASREQALRSRQLRDTYDQVMPDWQPEDVGGSPYAIGDYEVPDELGGKQGLADFRRRLNDRGISLILDFVPNHVGLGHSWLQFWPNLFVQGRPGSTESFRCQSNGSDHWIAHGKDPYFPAWVDTAQLDFRRAETHQAVLDTLQIVAGQCDGVRCDMAMLMLPEVFAKTWKHLPCAAAECDGDFWSFAVPAVKLRNPDFIFIAEAYWDLEQDLLDRGFDYAYDKWLYDHLQNDNGTGAVAHLRDKPEALIKRSVHFLENHDEARAATAFTHPEHRAAAILTCSLPGLRLLHEGQLSGARRQIPVQLSRRPVEEQDDYLFAFYTWLLRLLRATAIGHGRHKILPALPAWGTNETHEGVFVIQWQKEPGQFEIVAVNLTEGDAQCFVHPQIPELSRHQWKMTDLMGVAAFDRFGIELRHKGLYLALTSRAAHIYHFTTND
jgi:hypothetical protein